MLPVVDPRMGKAVEGGRPGEVYGPSGYLCFRVGEACGIAGVNDRQLRNLAADAPESRDPVPGERHLFYRSAWLDSLDTKKTRRRSKIPSSVMGADPPGDPSSQLTEGDDAVAALEARVNRLKADKRALGGQ